MIAAPGVPVIRNVNWGGLWTLYVKEVRRFFKVQLQTIWAPAVSQLLLLVVFTTAMGARGEVSVEMNGAPCVSADVFAEITEQKLLRFARMGLLME